MSKKAMKLALDLATMHHTDEGYDELRSKVRVAAKEALAKQEQGEPVAWMKEGWGSDCGPYVEFYRDDEMGWRDQKEWTPLYTTPQQRTWVGLTDDEVKKIAYNSIEVKVARAIEAKLKEKNT